MAVKEMLRVSQNEARIYIYSSTWELDNFYPIQKKDIMYSVQNHNIK